MAGIVWQRQCLSFLLAIDSEAYNFQLDVWD